MLIGYCMNMENYWHCRDASLLSLTPMIPSVNNSPFSYNNILYALTIPTL